MFLAAENYLKDFIIIIVTNKVEHGLKIHLGSLYVSGKLPTYPFPKATLTLTSHLGKNVGLGRGRWTVSHKLCIMICLYYHFIIGITLWDQCTSEALRHFLS